MRTSGPADVDERRTNEGYYLFAMVDWALIIPILGAVLVAIVAWHLHRIRAEEERLVDAYSTWAGAFESFTASHLSARSDMNLIESTEMRPAERFAAVERLGVATTAAACKLMEGRIRLRILEKDPTFVREIDELSAPEDSPPRKRGDSNELLQWASRRSAALIAFIDKVRARRTTSPWSP